MTIQSIADQIKPIITKHGVLRVGMFGSFARGQATNASDVDLLVQLNEQSSLLDFIRLKNELEQSLNKKVDLVEYDSLKPALRDDVLADEVVLYEAA